jgi:hypothetical protein
LQMTVKVIPITDEYRDGWERVFGVQIVDAPWKRQQIQTPFGIINGPYVWPVASDGKAVMFGGE